MLLVLQFVDFIFVHTVSGEGFDLDGLYVKAQLELPEGMYVTIFLNFVYDLSFVFGVLKYTS